MAEPEHVSLRVNISPALYARIGDFRHAKHSKPAPRRWWLYSSPVLLL